jgi:hypothetical protein
MVKIGDRDTYRQAGMMRSVTQDLAAGGKEYGVLDVSTEKQLIIRLHDAPIRNVWGFFSKARRKRI